MQRKQRVSLVRGRNTTEHALPHCGLGSLDQIWAGVDHAMLGLLRLNLWWCRPRLGWLLPNVGRFRFYEGITSSRLRCSALPAPGPVAKLVLAVPSGSARAPQMQSISADKGEAALTFWWMLGRPLLRTSGRSLSTRRPMPLTSP